MNKKIIIGSRGSKLALVYAQNAKSNMRIISGNQNSIGYSYKINKSTKAFIHYSSLSKEDKDEDVVFTSIGFEYKF